LGQGWLTIKFLLKKLLLEDHQSLFNLIPLSILAGMVMNYGIVLLLQSLYISLIIGCVLSGIGVFWFFQYLLTCKDRKDDNRSIISKFLFIFLILLFYGSAILVEPLRDWDARSIWFFHSKMIYVAGSIGESAGWQDPSIGFTHPDYPNLIPLIGAQVAYIMGFWNEYLPKISLFFMLIPATIWLATFVKRSFSFGFLIFMIPLSFGRWIWNGYMDGFLALYFVISILLLGRFLLFSSKVDLISSFGCLFVIMNIKNEGILAALVGFFLVLLLIIVNHENLSIKKIFENWTALLAGLIAIIPLGMWTFYKHQWNISNDLGIGTQQSFSRIFDRLIDGSYLFILQEINQQIEVAMLIFMLIFLASLYWKIKISKDSIQALLAAGLYGLGIFTIYLLTPNDLVWHLNTSISRTMLPVSGCLFVGSYFLLVKIESFLK
jgi:hypothetical protein